MSSSYTSGSIQETLIYGPYSNVVDVYGLKILGLGEVGGQPGVGSEFLGKTAQVFKLLLNPNADGISKDKRNAALEGLISLNVIQRVGVESYSAYSPSLDSGDITGWDQINDNYLATDFIWHLRSDNGVYTPSANAQITETIEHALHTLTQFALPAAFPNAMNVRSSNGTASGVTGDLEEAFQEAVRNGVYDPSDYAGANDGSESYKQLLLREYLYCLTYAEWGFIQLYADSQTLSPEWSNSHLTQSAIERDNPLGHKIFTDYVSKVISKPSSQSLELIFQDGDLGVSGYQPSAPSDYEISSLDINSTTNTNSILHVEGHVYRLRNDSTGKFIFSANSGEIDIITGQGWVNEGAAYSSPTNATTDLHRFLMSNGGHFYTANTFEKNILLQDSSFTYEGIAYQVYSTAEPPQGSIPVIRYLSSSGSHLYSTSQYEQSILDASSQWVNEGIAWYGEAI